MSSQVFIFRLELEWSIVNGVECCIVFTMKCKADKAVLLDIFTTNIKLDHTVGEIDAIDPRHAFSFVFAQSYPGMTFFVEKGYLTIERLYFLVLDFLMDIDNDGFLTRELRECRRDDNCRQYDHN